MKPLFREIDKKYIEVVGHYDNPILCAKMTLLADLYAVEHKEGYALFKVEDYDKLAKIDKRLEFTYSDDEPEPANTISDLTGTTWYFNETINLNDTGVSPVREQPTHYKYINFTSDGKTFSELVVGSSNGTRWNILGYNGDIYSDSPYQMGMWLYEEYRTITITGGTDATNANLIAWLQANATQVPTGNTYEVTHSLTNLTHGNISFTIVPDTGYALPATSAGITVTNGTLVSYDSSTGVVVISGDDTTTVSVICEEAAPTLISFSITDTLTHTWNYQAEEGMTWQEWCASEYNNAGWTANVNENKIIKYGLNEYIVNNVIPTDTIIGNNTYTCNVTGGGGNN